MPSFRRFIALLLLIAALLPACSTDTVVVSPTSFYAAYSPTVLNYASGHGGILVQVVGNPFDVPQAELEQAITDAMTGSHFGPRVDFVTEAPEGFRLPYRAVLLFGAGAGPDEIRLCAGDPESFQKENDELVRVIAYLCAADKPLTTLFGRVAADGPGDPRFLGLMRQVTLNLFPPSNPDRRDSDRGFFIH